VLEANRWGDPAPGEGRATSRGREDADEVQQAGRLLVVEVHGSDDMDVGGVCPCADF
jgi:hypothetical protein